MAVFLGKSWTDLSRSSLSDEQQSFLQIPLSILKKKKDRNLLQEEFLGFLNEHVPYKPTPDNSNFDISKVMKDLEKFPIPEINLLFSSPAEGPLEKEGGSSVSIFVVLVFLFLALGSSFVSIARRGPVFLGARCG